MAYDDGMSMAQMPDRCQGCPGQRLCYELGADCGDYPPLADVSDIAQARGVVL
jgi:hypothetical protein